MKKKIMMQILLIVKDTFPEAYIHNNKIKISNKISIEVNTFTNETTILDRNMRYKTNDNIHTSIDNINFLLTKNPNLL